MSNDNIVKLFDPDDTGPEYKNIVDMLEHVTGQARLGIIKNAAVIAIGSDGILSVAPSGSMCPSCVQQMLGAFEIMKYHILASCVDAP